MKGENVGDNLYPCEKVDMRFFETAPFLFPTEIDLDCSPDKLFDIFEEAESWTVWATPITHVEWTSPKPFGVGTTRTVSLSNGVGEEEFIAWERGKRMAFRFNRSSTKNMNAFGEDYVVTDLGSGRCRLRWTVGMDLKGINRFLLPLAKPLLHGQFKKFLKKLQAYVKTR